MCYHLLKFVLVYSAMRHFARDLRERGWTIDYHFIHETPAFEEGLRRHMEKFRPNELLIVEPNSFAETDAIEKLARKMNGPLRLTSATQFLLTRDESARRAENAANYFTARAAKARKIRSSSIVYFAPNESRSPVRLRPPVRA